MTDVKRCAICNQEYTEYGNNAWPVAEGQCCDQCNFTQVIPARLELVFAEAETTKKEDNT